LNAEIAEEIRLIAARWFEAASSHEEEDHRAMDFVAGAEVKRRLGFGRMECTLGIELRVHLEFWSKFMADDETRKPAIGPVVDKLLADFEIDIDGAKFLREFKGQDE
jgi:hypothetical protein